MKNTQRKTVKSYLTIRQRITAAFTAVIMLAQICIPTIALGTTAWGNNFESRLANELSSPMVELIDDLTSPEAYKGAYFIHKSTLNQTTLDSFYQNYPKGKPAQKPKFVGDSFVQSRIIRAQYRSLMGRYFFSGVLRSEEIEAIETSRLYENAKTYAAANNLTLGNPLGNAAPLQDMIWPELKQINGKSYLVPVVHLSQNTLNNKVVGHLIEFDSNAVFAGIQLDFATLIAGYNSTITGLGGIINNGGDIKSPGNLTLATNGTLANMGGNITAAQNLTIYSNDFYNKTLVVPYKDKNGEGTRLGAVAGINAQDGNLLIKAANNITFAGSTAGAGGTLTLNAAGDINILPVVTGGSSQSQEGHWKVNKNTTDLLMSRLAADDTLSLIASGVINITASELISTKGGIELLAQNGIHIIDELEQTQIQKVDRKGKTTGTSSEFRTEAVRAILKAGKGVLLDSAHGDVVLKATEITSADGTQVNARDGKVHLLMTKELEEFHLQTVKKSTWTIKTRTEDVIHENNIQNAILGGLKVQATYGINVEYTGKEGATLKEQIEEFRKVPEMKWMADLYDQALADAGPGLNWEVMEEVHKEIRKTKRNLSPAAMAIIAICVAVAMGPVGASLVGSSGGGVAAAISSSIGGTLGAAVSAGAVALTTQAVQSLAAGNNLRETLNAMDSDESLRSLAISMVTAGAMQHTDFKIFDAVKGDSLGVSLARQAGHVVVDATVSAGISVAINGGNFDAFKNTFKQSLIANSINTIGEHMAKTIGKAFDHGIDSTALDTALKYISHAASGCIIGAATAQTSNSSSQANSSCLAGAGGAVIGEYIGSKYRNSNEVLAAKEAIDSFIAENGETVAKLRAAGYTNEKILEIFSSRSNVPYLMNQLDQLQRKGVDLAKLGAAFSAFAVGANESQINIAASMGETTAQNNALSLIGAATVFNEAIDSLGKGTLRFAGSVTGSCLSIAFIIKDSAILIYDVQQAQAYLQSGGTSGSKESFEKMVQLFSGVSWAAQNLPEALSVVQAYYQAQLDGALGEMSEGNNFTAGVVFGKNAFDIYGILRTLPEMAALVQKALPAKAAAPIIASGAENNATKALLADDLLSRQAIDPRVGTTLEGATGKIEITAEGTVGGKEFFDTNQTARPVSQADPNKPTLVADLNPANNVNKNMKNAHAEIAVLQRAYDSGVTTGADMAIVVRGVRDVCGHCQSVIWTMADRAGLKSLKVVDTFDNKTWVWRRDTNTVQELDGAFH
ncbi:cytidine deaminase-like fold-containing protein [Cellvibrio mixtus]|uniref:cytidine deaminase-like fold-containing protein n=1 Tax=Cellvibrio mixtus TaxID=39650 RepID=UPI0005876C72|nr:DUF637 domain-containing protein [Cellvibrio mixtus]